MNLKKLLNRFFANKYYSLTRDSGEIVIRTSKGLRRRSFSAFEPRLDWLPIFIEYHLEKGSDVLVSTSIIWDWWMTMVCFKSTTMTQDIKRMCKRLRCDFDFVEGGIKFYR